MNRLFSLLLVLLPMVANAEEIKGMLVHTASTHYGSVLTSSEYGQNTIDNPTGKEYFNNDQTAGWGAQAFAHFTFEIPEDYVVMSATLTWSYYQNNASARATQIYYLKEGVELNYSTDGEGTSLMNTNYDEKNGGINHRYPTRRTQICVTEAMSGKSDHKNINTDVTEVIRAIGHQGFVVFQWTGNAGGGWLYGSQSMMKPVLAIVAEKAHVGDGVTMMKGGQFMDRILPMPAPSVTKTSSWGPGVADRYIANGVEDNHISFWGGNVLKGADGKYHINVAGWNSDAHNHTWWSRSDVYHAVSDNLYGPYKVTNNSIIGAGHNPDTYLTDDGTYVCYVLMNNSKAEKLTTRDLNGTWKRSTFELDARGRKYPEGSAVSNFTFSKRADGSFLALSREGYVWISRDGNNDPYHEVTDKSVYAGDTRYFEDPLVWKDPLQYHMIVNDWNAKQAYYSRSADGIHWVTEQGFAYKPGCVRHEDGTVENWYKLERPRVYIGEDGYAEMFNLAVIDTGKSSSDKDADGNYDEAGDNHSSKNVMMPLNKGILMEVQNETMPPDGAEWNVVLKDVTLTDINTESLVFGNFNKVNFGFGMHCTAAVQQDNDVLLTFKGDDHGMDAIEFAPKMLGEDKSGNMIYGYARLPWYEYDAPIISARCPLIYNNKVTRVIIENYGMKASAVTTFTIRDNKGATVANGFVNALPAYGSETIIVEQLAEITSGATGFTLTFADGETNTFTCDMSDTDADFGASINEIQPTSKGRVSDNNVYSINGQRIAQPTKGIYIVNDRKILY